MKKYHLWNYAYFACNNMTSDPSSNKRYSYRHDTIRTFLQKYGIKPSELNGKKFNVARFNQSLPVRLCY